VLVTVPWEPLGGSCGSTVGRWAARARALQARARARRLQN